MTIADICRAWDRPSYVHGDVPSTHTVTRKFREGDRTPETVGHVLMKYQPYLQRYANRHFPKYLDEAEEAYVDFVLAVVKRPYLFNKDFEKPLRSFVFRRYKHKLLDIRRPALMPDEPNVFSKQDERSSLPRPRAAASRPLPESRAKKRTAR